LEETVPKIDAPEPFRILTTTDGAHGRACPFGELDVSTAPEVDRALAALRAAGCRELVLDLGGLSFMDSSGLNLALRWMRDARRDGYGFAVAPGPRLVQRVVAVAGLEGVVPFDRGRERAATPV
jgi:anti-sigma B factor antagonist